MKKLNVLLILSVMASAVFFSSCVDDEDPLAPVITFQDYNGEALERDLGEEIGISFIVRQGDAKLEDVVVKLGQGEIYKASTDKEMKIEDGMTVTLNQKLEIVGAQNLTITAIDKADLKAEKTIAITVASDLDDKGSKMLGAGNNTNGSFYSLATNEVIKQAAAQADPAIVSVVYNYTDANGAQIYSPTESSALDFPGSTATETVFATLTKVAYETATSADIPADFPLTKVTDLAANDVIAFKTADGTVGIIKVTAIDAGADGMATLSIKTKIVE